MSTRDFDNQEFGELLFDYLPRLLRLAETNMAPRIKAQVGTEDMAHSILGSVFRLERKGKLNAEQIQSEDFWKLLQVIALCKIRKKVRALTTKKADINREQALTHEMPPLEELAIDSVAPTDEDGRWFEEVLEKLYAALDDDQRIVLDGKLAGDRTLQIAQRLADGEGMSTKTVTRIWNRIQQIAETIGDEYEIGGQ